MFPINWSFCHLSFPILTLPFQYLECVYKAFFLPNILIQGKKQCRLLEFKCFKESSFPEFFCSFVVSVGFPSFSASQYPRPMRKLYRNPILDTRISVRPSSVTLRLPPLKSETGCTGELWSNCVLLILKN